MAADLTFKIDGDSSGLEGVVNSAMQKLQKFGETGGLVGRATSVAMKGVTGAVKSAESSINSFTQAGKGAVAMLNHINGAVELANKVIPALTFPLAMADNAEKTKDAFDKMTGSWGELAGALGEGINDALTPVMKSAGLEMGKLKEQARGIGQNIGDAIDLTRVSYQMGQLPDILWLGLQKVTLQWGANLIEFFTTIGFKISRIFNDAMTAAIAGAWDALGADGKASTIRSANEVGKKASVSQEADALAATKQFLSPVYDQIGELGKQMDALTAPVKERIAKEKEAAKATEAVADALKNLLPAPQLKKSGDVNAPQGPGMPKPASAGHGTGGGSGSSRARGASVSSAFVGPKDIRPQYTDAEIEKARNELGMPPPGGEQAPAAMPDKRKGHGTHHIKGAGFGKKDIREGISYFNGHAMAKPATPNLDGGISTPRLDAAAAFRGSIKGAGHKLDPATLVHGVTNKTGARAAAKKEREAGQKDSVSAKAAEAVATLLPQMGKALDMLAKKLNVEMK